MNKDSGPTLAETLHTLRINIGLVSVRKKIRGQQLWYMKKEMKVSRKIIGTIV